MTISGSNPFNAGPFGSGSAGSEIGAGAADALAKNERFEDLLIDRATAGLSEDEGMELAELAVELGRRVDDERYERVAAALDVGMDLQSAERALPTGLEARLVSAGVSWSAEARAALDRNTNAGTAPALTLVGTSPMVGSARKRRGAFGDARAWGGWLAAAACLTFAVVSRNASEAERGGVNGPRELTSASGHAGGTGSMASLLRLVTGAQTPAEARASVINTEFKDASDVVTVPMLSSASVEPSEITVPNALGDVIWSGQKQRGMLHITALEPLTQKGETYQLWIVDSARDERFPVSGGTFTVSATDPVTLVPFQPSLPVSEALRFVITIERAGGAVVSSGDDVTGVAPTPRCCEKTTENSAKSGEVGPVGKAAE
ncbi:hypothetical protein BH11PLA1_BH11PLA1_12740 [soil metagenome]